MKVTKGDLTLRLHENKIDFWAHRKVPVVVHFTQEEIKSFLPYIQSFANNGTLEPATESPLQGGDQDSMSKEWIKGMTFAVYRLYPKNPDIAQNIADLGVRIQVLEQLIRKNLEAHKLVERGFHRDEEIEAYGDACSEFIREAKKLLGEED